MVSTASKKVSMRAITRAACQHPPHPSIGDINLHF